jgi:DnaJ-domain-containing protein 1
MITDMMMGHIKRTASVRFALDKFALASVAPAKEVRRRFASLNCAPVQLAPFRLA